MARDLLIVTQYAPCGAISQTEKENGSQEKSHSNGQGSEVGKAAPRDQAAQARTRVRVRQPRIFTTVPTSHLTNRPLGPWAGRPSEVLTRGQRRGCVRGSLRRAGIRGSSPRPDQAAIASCVLHTFLRLCRCSRRVALPVFNLSDCALPASATRMNKAFWSVRMAS